MAVLVFSDLSFMLLLEFLESLSLLDARIGILLLSFTSDSFSFQHIAVDITSDIRFHLIDLFKLSFLEFSYCSLLLCCLFLSSSTLLLLSLFDSLSSLSIELLLLLRFLNELFQAFGKFRTCLIFFG